MQKPFHFCVKASQIGHLMTQLGCYRVFVYGATSRQITVLSLSRRSQSRNDSLLFRLSRLKLASTTDFLQFPSRSLGSSAGVKTEGSQSKR